MSNKDYDESLNEFALAEKAVEVSKPMLTVIHALKGYSHFCRMDYKKSERCYTEALRLSPFDSTSLSRRVSLYIKVGRGTYSSNSSTRQLLTCTDLHWCNLRASEWQPCCYS